MTSTRFRTIIVGSALLLSGCSYASDVLWPSLTGEDPAGAPTTQAAPPASPVQQAQAPVQAPVLAPVQAPVQGGVLPPAPAPAFSSQQPPLGSSSFKPGGVTPGSPTGTFVGKKVVELRAELKRLQGNISLHNKALQQLRAKMVQDSQRYHGTVAAVNARLQVGTTPGNPILVQQFNGALSDLDRLSSDIAEMNKLTTGVAEDSTLSAFLAESARAAFGLSGAIDEDHTQLAILEDEVNRTVVLVDRLLKELTDDIRRQTAYVSTERSNLNLLSTGIKSGEIYGASLINRAMVSTAGAGDYRARAMDTTNRRPLVVIRFDRPSVPFEQALYNAVSQVLDRRPNAVFDLVAVAPAGGGQARVAINSTKARQHAEKVLRSLLEMGLPPGRVAVSAKTSAQAKSNEVHLYLR